jgi:hypothetical protein
MQSTSLSLNSGRVQLQSRRPLRLRLAGCYLQLPIAQALRWTCSWHVRAPTVTVTVTAPPSRLTRRPGLGVGLRLPAPGPLRLAASGC